jgi:2-oxoisovalerate ferredoxin oxidoreductase delta subunit
MPEEKDMQSTTCGDEWVGTGKKSGKRYISINFSECTACGQCVDACPKQGIRMTDKSNDRGYYYAEFVGGDDCIGCASCYYACPEPFAIEVHMVGG